MYEMNRSGFYLMETIMTMPDLLNANGRCWSHNSILATLADTKYYAMSFRTPATSEGKVVIIAPSVQKDGSVVLIEFFEGATVTGGVAYEPVCKNRRRVSVWPCTEKVEGTNVAPNAISVTGGTRIGHEYILGTTQGTKTVVGEMPGVVSSLILAADTVYTVKATAVGGSSTITAALTVGFIPRNGA
jgi:hypothetical protein